MANRFLLSHLEFILDFWLLFWSLYLDWNIKNNSFILCWNFGSIVCYRWLFNMMNNFNSNLSFWFLSNLIDNLSLSFHLNRFLNFSLLNLLLLNNWIHNRLEYSSYIFLHTFILIHFDLNSLMRLLHLFTFYFLFLHFIGF